jgi:nucleotide-binding universal stress UspA family protein
MEKILVPTDFSENATNAVKYAIHFAQSTGKSLVFLNVTHKDILTSKAHDVYLKKVAVAIDQAGVDLRKYINKIYKNLHLELNPLKVTFDVRFGHSAQDEIVVSAEKHKVSMIIMGTLGATGLKKFFVGSNTSGVIQNVNCPVLAVPAKIKYREIEKIGYSSNFENLSADVKQLLPIVKSYSANLDIFSVYPVYPIKVDFEKFDIDEKLKSLKDEFKYKNISLNLIKRAQENDLEGGVAKFIKVFKPDMIIMFTQSRNWFERLLHSSATEKIVLNPKVPILSFKA